MKSEMKRKGQKRKGWEMKRKEMYKNKMQRERRTKCKWKEEQNAKGKKRK